MDDTPLIGATDRSIFNTLPGKQRSGVRRRLKDGALHFACWLLPILIPRLSRFLVLWLGTLLGHLACLFMERRIFRIALANLEVAFGTSISMKTKRAIIRRSICNMVQVGVDLAWFSRDREVRIRKYVSCDASLEECQVSHPSIAISAHFGNWEVLNQGLAILKQIPLSIPYAPFRDPVLRQTLQRLRSGTMTQFIPRDGAGPKLWDALTDQRMVGMLIDQNVLPSRGGGFVNFFGLPAAAPLGAAKLAARSQLPIFAIFCVPQARGHYRIYARPLDLSSDHAESSRDSTWVTQRIMNVIEDEIRRRPELWLWTYHRWNSIPFGEVSFSKYPFYAQQVILPRNLIPPSLRRARKSPQPLTGDNPKKTI